jgi:hypothetical protein
MNTTMYPHTLKFSYLIFYSCTFSRTRNIIFILLPHGLWCHVTGRLWVTTKFYVEHQSRMSISVCQISCEKTVMLIFYFVIIWHTFSSSQIQISLPHCRRLWIQWSRIVPLMLGGHCTTTSYCQEAPRCSGTLDDVYRGISKGQ